MKATYVKTQIKNVINISKIVTVHYYEFDKSFIFDGESHDFWEMVYIDKGRVQIRSDEDDLELAQGEIVFHKPNEFHSIRALDSAPNFFVISFVCNSPIIACFEKYHTVLDKMLQGFISSIIEEAECCYVIPKNDTNLKKLVKKQTAPIGSEQLIKTYLEQLLILLIRNIIKKDAPSLFPSKESMQTHLVTMAKEIIIRKAKERFYLNDLCAELGYSRSYLCRLFRDQTGDTVLNFALKQKIKLAKQLIREGVYNFTEISDSLSFENPQYFSRVFKRITGMSPSEFRSSLRLSN